jgi:hypothetical protein
MEPIADSTGRRLASKGAGSAAAISSVIETEAAALACARMARLHAVRWAMLDSEDVVEEETELEKEKESSWKEGGPRGAMIK